MNYFSNTIFKSKGCALLIPLIVSCGQKNKYNNWETYGGDNGRTHYSTLNQIDTTNVTHLQKAWVYHTGDVQPSSQIQVNPIIINNILYGVSPQLKLFALDGETGKSKWVFDPVAQAAAGTEGERLSINVCRGVTYYKDKEDGDRIF